MCTAPLPAHWGFDLYLPLINMGGLLLLLKEKGDLWGAALTFAVARWR